MRKYTGLSLVLIMCVATATGYGLTRTAKAAALNSNENDGDAMFKTLDSSLAAKIKDYLQIIDHMQKLSDAKAPSQTSNQDHLLSGERSVAPQLQQRTPVAVKAQPEKPWWSGYQLNMIVYSDKSRNAVVNGKYLREGDSVENGVVVKKIDPQSVTLEHHHGKSHTSSKDPQDDLITLFVQAKNMLHGRESHGSS